MHVKQLLPNTPKAFCKYASEGGFVVNKASQTKTQTGFSNDNQLAASINNELINDILNG